MLYRIFMQFLVLSWGVNRLKRMLYNWVVYGKVSLKNLSVRFGYKWTSVMGSVSEWGYVCSSMHIHAFDQLVAC